MDYAFIFLNFLLFYLIIIHAPDGEASSSLSSITTGFSRTRSPQEIAAESDIQRINKKHDRSEVWSISRKKVQGTVMLVRHLRKVHRDEYNVVMQCEAKKKTKQELEEKTQKKLSQFVSYFPTFEKAFLNWMIQTYQPVSCCEKKLSGRCVKVLM